jgi:DNA-binding response OmpR family regulator
MTDQLPLVLIVEDESDLANIYERWLGEKYRVRTAYDGDEAVEQLDNEIDLILVDRRIPGRCGAEVVEEAHEQGINCRVSVVTAMKREFGTTGINCDDYLLKPVKRDELIETTENLLSTAAT